jgi:hypothetical protein
MRLCCVFFRLCGARQGAPWVIGLLLALSMSLLVPAAGHARAVFDRADAAFDGSITLPPPGFSGAYLIRFLVVDYPYLWYLPLLQ